MRDRDRLFEGTDQMTDGVFWKVHTNALSRWTLTGLMTKGVFAADQFKLEDNPSARLFSKIDWFFFRTQDLKRYGAIRTDSAKLGDDLKGITTPSNALQHWQKIDISYIDGSKF